MTLKAASLNWIPTHSQTRQFACEYLNFTIIKPADRSSYWKVGTVAPLVFAFIAALVCIKMRGAGWQKLQIPVITASILTVGSIGLYIYCKQNECYISRPPTIKDPVELTGVSDLLRNVEREQTSRRSDPKSVQGRHYLETSWGSTVHALVYLRHLVDNLPTLPSNYSPPERPYGTALPQAEALDFLFKHKTDATNPQLHETVYLLTLLGNSHRALLDKAHTIWVNDGGVDDVAPPQ